IRDFHVTGVQTCALPIFGGRDLLVVDGREVEQGAGDVALVRVGRLEDAVAVGVAAQLGTGRIRPLDLSDDLTEGVAPATAVGLEIGRASCRESGEGSQGG